MLFFSYVMRIVHGTEETSTHFWNSCNRTKYHITLTRFSTASTGITTQMRILMQIMSRQPFRTILKFSLYFPLSFVLLSCLKILLPLLSKVHLSTGSIILHRLFFLFRWWIFFLKFVAFFVFCTRSWIADFKSSPLCATHLTGIRC